MPRATYLPLIPAITGYAQRHKAAIGPAATAALGEIGVRLARLDKQYDQLLEMNETLRKGSATTMTYDESSATFKVSGIGLGTHTFQIPGVSGPMKSVGEVGDISAFTAGAPSQRFGPEHASLCLDLEEVLETYYYGAHRVTVLVRMLPGQKRFSCIEMINVRNHLLEHTKNEPSYNFGYGSGGPFVRPMRPAGSQLRDLGAVVNTEAYIAALNKVFGS